MERIRFFRQNRVDELKNNIEENLPWYRNHEDATLEPVSEGYGEMSISATADFSCFDTLNSNFSEDKDLDNVLAIYNAFHVLSPQQAAEERIWTYATHMLARQYTANRWSKIPIEKDKAVKYISTHYFVSGTRGLIRDNAVARLWWMGYIASRCRHYDLKSTLTILLKSPDVRANLLERSSVSMSEEMFSGVIRILGQSLDVKDGQTIYEREKFRNFMKMLNRRGGRIMLNALQEQQLNTLLEEMEHEVTQKKTAHG